MEWTLVITFILIGLGLIVVEVVLVPGTTLVGIVGFGMTIAGIIMSFKFFGETTGWITLGGSAIVSAGMLYWSLHVGAWKQFSLKDAIDSKVNEGVLSALKEGQEGMAVSALRPMGKAEVAGKLYEVRTQGGFINSGTKIKIVKISSSQIIVEAIL
jgi:membrane-bound ClpP family serine protease